MAEFPGEHGDSRPCRSSSARYWTRYSPNRPDNKHLGFGSGLHYCFGAPLARVEVHPVVAALASRLDNPSL